MSAIADWLADIGLERYSETFAENGIGIDVLGDLTDADLRELGLTLGDRKRLLKATAALAALPAEERQADQPAVASPGEAERRQLTVMFCDLVGSTALSARLDPEDLREVIGGYHRLVSEVVGRHGGFVAKYMGDGVLVYFGYPQAHEADAERAVRAGLELVRSVGRLTAAGESLKLRVGIATGLVVVGDLTGKGETQERGVVGETPNLAARLQALSLPGTVVVSRSTRRLVGDLFECRSLGEQHLKGFGHPVEAWQVIGEGEAESRFEALRSGHSQLVGREEEIELLLRRWRHIQQGQGRVVLLSGEPGIGKSRLVAGLQEWLQGETHLRLGYFCSPHHQNTALQPVIAQLERAAKLQHDDDAEIRLGKLESLLARSATTQEDVVLIAELLSIPTEGRYLPLNLSAQRKRERTLEALVRQVEELASREPMLVLFEDVHWIDPTTRELLDLIVERVQQLAVLMIITFRPEFQAPWVGRPQVTALSLNRLDRRQGAAIAGQIAGTKALPPEVLEQIILHTDGVPLFVEELTKTVLESGVLQEEKDRFVLPGPLPSIAVPTTLYDALMARLDRLAAVKEVAQIGAVIGREFSYDLLKAIAGLPEEGLKRALDQLVTGELVFQRGVLPEAVYTFKHALVQDATYGSLLREKRQHLHARIAQVLEGEPAETAQPETVAHHYTEAGLLAQAMPYWRRAGDRAAKQFANREAINHYRKGLELISKLPASDDRDVQELELLVALGPVLMTVMTTGAEEIHRIYARARELARSDGRTRDLFTALWGYWLISNVGGQHEVARQLTSELTSLADDLDDNGLRLQACHAGFSTAAVDSDLTSVVPLIMRALELYDPVVHRDHALTYGGHDPGVCAYCQLSLIRLLTGYPAEAVAQLDAGLALARQLAQPPSIAHALRFVGDIYSLLNQPDKVFEAADAILRLPTEQLSSVGISNARMLRGWALIHEGKAEGISELERALDDWRATRSLYMAGWRLARAASGFAIGRRVEAASELLDEAVGVQEHSGTPWIEPELLRLRGELMLMRDPGSEEAADWFEKALARARRCGLRWFELRAACSLAELWLRTGRAEEARKVLAPVIAGFTEGKDTPDLKAAAAILERTHWMS